MDNIENKNLNEEYDYDELKNSYMIVMEIRNYVVLNDGTILLKGKDNKLRNADENNEFVKEIKSLLHQKEDSNEIRRIDRDSNSGEELEP